MKTIKIYVGNNPKEELFEEKLHPISQIKKAKKELNKLKENYAIHTNTPYVTECFNRYGKEYGYKIMVNNMMNIKKWLEKRKFKEIIEKQKKKDDIRKRAKKEAEEQFNKKYLNKKVITKSGITGIMLKMERFSYVDYSQSLLLSEDDSYSSPTEGIIQVGKDKFIINLNDIQAIEPESVQQKTDQMKNNIKNEIHRAVTDIR